FVALLPYMEQKTVYDNFVAYDQSNPGMSLLSTLSTTPEPPWRVLLPTMLCPSDANHEPIHPSWKTGATSYVVSSGDIPFNSSVISGSTYAPNGVGIGRGPFQSCRFRSLAAITDGTSNTVMFSERLSGFSNGISRRVIDTYVTMGWPVSAGVSDDPTANGPRPLDPVICFNFVGTGGNYLPKEGFPAGSAVATNNTCGRHWAYGMANYTSFSTIYPPNAPACTSRYHWVGGPTSNHAGGANVCFSDGSVRFVSDMVHTGDLSLPPVRSGESPYGVWGACGSAAGCETSMSGL
ncbi:MAG: DUF1559 domain-containing protein, partial [Planctomycetia bacterium]|nr:DUF1559 domain-containing protein [Planctomycetia bacterium]